MEFRRSYAGPYGKVLQRAVAKAICDAVVLISDPSKFTSQSDGDRWVNAEAALGAREKDTAYVFFTHSLGSRILYDIMRNLNRVNRYGDDPFVNGTDDQAFETYPMLTCQVPAIYMTANQLPLVGLSSGGTLPDVIASDPVSQSIQQAAVFLSERKPQSSRPLPCNAELPEGASNRLNPLLTAFADPNDLLTRGIRSIWILGPSSPSSSTTSDGIGLDSTTMQVPLTAVTSRTRLSVELSGCGTAQWTNPRRLP
jgi:hypothetical protein